MSHALLLRLFLSPSFFSVNVALQYLTLYHNNIGITYYLTRRLREFDISELRDVWGFICHLLLTRPSKSRALECFVVDTCERSTHMAMFTLWFMQAHLKDLALSRSDSKSFILCQRIMHRCHEIIFEDSLGLVTGPYSSMKVRSQKHISRKRVKYHLEPALVGIACVLAGPSTPCLTEIMGSVAIEQGRADDSQQGLRSLEFVDDGKDVPTPVTNMEEEADDEEKEEPGPDPSLPLQRATLTGDTKDRVGFKDLSHSQRMREAAQTSPAFMSLKDGIRRTDAADDPFGQLDATPSQSSPEISRSASKKAPTSASGNMVDSLLQDYDNLAQSHLLRGHYCRSEIQFILALENIANHLLVVPKLARVSALRAELTSLNHKLPAEICMPMWCSGVELFSDPKISAKPHHRIVRIPPGESVVLNSAERAPFLLYIEVLHDDLDFDPMKRSNKELLKEIIRKDMRSAKPPGEDFSRRGGFDDRYSSSRAQGSNGEDDPSVEAHDVEDDLALSTIVASPTAESSQANSDEEVDLVEQVYGEDFSVHQTPDLSESLVVPAPPKNKALDIATWSRASSLPVSPAMTPSISMSEAFQKNAHRTISSLPLSDLQPDSLRLPVLSLDDYSERMRTAAVMLAQLNASLVKETITPLPQIDTMNSPNGSASESSSKWLPSNWISVQNPDSAGPVHPSLSGKLRDPSKNAHVVSATRLKLQSGEVAAIRERIMQEMLALEEERMGRMRADPESDGMVNFESGHGGLKTAEDEQIIRRELNRVDPSSIVFQESWTAKKSRIRQGSPYGHLAAWDCVSVIVKTGADLRQEQLAVQMIREFDRIWREENCQCWVRSFQIVITGGSSGLVETITDAVSIHSIKKALYARRLAEGRLGQVTLLDHFINSYGDPSSAKFARARRNFIRSLAGYSIITYLLQIKDRHNGNILLDRDGHLIHIDFGFMLSNTPGNIGIEAAPFKLTFDYVEVLGGVDSAAFRDYKRLVHEGFEIARKHCDRIIAIVELMQKDSSLPCFVALGEQTAQQLRERFQSKSSQQSAADHVERMIMTSLGSNWTRLYDSYQYYSQSIL